MPFVYILRSKKDGSFFIGKTFDLEQRIMYHNTVELNEGTSKSGIPWEYFYTMEVKSYFLAGKLEKHLKEAQSTSYYMELIENQEIGQKLIAEYS